MLKNQNTWIIYQLYNGWLILLRYLDKNSCCESKIRELLTGCERRQQQEVVVFAHGKLIRNAFWIATQSLAWYDYYHQYWFM